MEQEDYTSRIASLEELHKYQHAIVAALEAEKAPVEYINKAKQAKLVLKDKIQYLKNKVDNT